MQLCKNIIQLIFRNFNDFAGICRGFIANRIQIFGTYRNTAAACRIITGISEAIENSADPAGINILLAEYIDDPLAIGLKQLILFQIHQITLVYHIGIA